MRSGSLPQLVHVRTLAYPLTRRVACQRRLARMDHAIQGNFPLSTPERLIVLRARVCTRCLADAAVNQQSGVTPLALAIVQHLGEWYATRHTRRLARAFGKGHATPPPGVRRRR